MERKDQVTFTPPVCTACTAKWLESGLERLIGRVRWEAVTGAPEVAALVGVFCIYSSTAPIVT